MMSAAGLGASPAEAHGIACGVSLAANEDPQAAWQAALTAALDAGDGVADECARALGELFDDALRELADETFEWQLLLPTDDAPLSARCAALRDWCEGFLFGLGSAADLVFDEAVSRDMHDALTDLSEITRLDADISDQGEAAEADFTELAEFVRVAARLVGEEIRATGENVS